MAIKVDMSSPDVDRQIALLKYFPEIVEKHFRNVMVVDIGLLYDAISPNIPRLTGKAQSTFRKRVTGKGIDLTGQVGWWGKNSAWYINVVEYGAKPHEINSFAPGAGVYIKKHPGFGAREFMKRGFESMQSVIETDMAVASENVVNELAVK